MKILIAGSSGLIGQAFLNQAQKLGHTCCCLLRNAPPKEPPCQVAYWDPAIGSLDHELVENSDVVVNLCGAPIHAKFWTQSYKDKIRQSRILSTALLAEHIRSAENPPKVFLSASAIGYYGNRSSETLDEDSQKGVGFLAQVADEWEEVANSAQDHKTRVVNLRFGIVLGKQGGALKQMLSLAKFGISPCIGEGENFMSYITLDDTIRAILHCMENPHIAGPVNICCPNSVRTSEFAQALGIQLKKKLGLQIPPSLLRVARGSMVDEVLLTSTRAYPSRLVKSKFNFLATDLASCLKLCLTKR